jgi:hypothetical protein
LKAAPPENDSVAKIIDLAGNPIVAYRFGESELPAAFLAYAQPDFAFLTFSGDDGRV